MRALEVSQAVGFVDEKGGLDGMVEAGGKNFSGGQRARLCIARAIAGEPELVILDDSFAALDAATEAKLREELKSYLDKNTSVITVSQRYISVKNSDIILVLDDGNMVGYGDHDSLLDTCEVYKEIVRVGGGV